MAARLEIDFEANAAYLRVSDLPVSETHQVSPGVLVDLDEFGMAVGIEILDLGLKLSITQIEHDCHIASKDAALLNAILPNVTTFVSHHVGSVSNPRENPHVITNFLPSAGSGT